MPIYVFRHASTSYNHKNVYAGLTDIDINFKGVIQANFLRYLLKNEKLDKAYSSTLKRCVRTLEIVLKGHDAPVIYDERLNERDFGSVTGFRKDKISDFHKTHKSKDIKYNWYYKTSTGESFECLEKKMLEFISSLASDAKNSNIAICTSSGPLRIIRKYFLGLSINEALKLRNPNCEIFKFS